MINLEPELLEILACPQCKSPLQADQTTDELVCTNPECALAYPVRDDIPVLLVDEARRPRAADELENTEDTKAADDGNDSEAGRETAVAEATDVAEEESTAGTGGGDPTGTTGSGAEQKDETGA